MAEPIVSTVVAPVGIEQVESSTLIESAQVDDYVRSKKLAKQLQHVDVMEDYLKKVPLLFKPKIN